MQPLPEILLPECYHGDPLTLSIRLVRARTRPGPVNYNSVMERSALITLFLSAAFCSSLIAEQPILQPYSFGFSFEGPALGLECVAALMSDPGKFFESVRAESPTARPVCIGQLLESLTPELPPVRCLKHAAERH